MLGLAGLAGWPAQGSNMRKRKRFSTCDTACLYAHVDSICQQSSSSSGMLQAGPPEHITLWCTSSSLCALMCTAMAVDKRQPSLCTMKQAWCMNLPLEVLCKRSWRGQHETWPEVLLWKTDGVPWHGTLPSDLWFGSSSSMDDAAQFRVK
jgi:hypothetical protein